MCCCLSQFSVMLSDLLSLFQIYCHIYIYIYYIWLLCFWICCHVLVLLSCFVLAAMCLHGFFLLLLLFLLLFSDLLSCFWIWGFVSLVVFSDLLSRSDLLIHSLIGQCTRNQTLWISRRCPRIVTYMIPCGPCLRAWPNEGYSIWKQQLLKQLYFSLIDRLWGCVFPSSLYLMLKLSVELLS